MTPRPLQVAIYYWKRGEDAPLDTIVALLDLGLDVSTLEARYRA